MLNVQLLKVIKHIIVYFCRRDLARMRQRYEEERATAKVVKRRLSTIQDMVRSSDEESGSSQYLSAAEEDV